MKTGNYDKYVELLNQSTFNEWWYEETSITLTNLSLKFEREEWDLLLKEILDFPHEKQEMCLYTVDEASPVYAIKLAALMIRSHSQDVVTQALSTINECLDHAVMQEDDIDFLRRMEKNLPNTIIANAIYSKVREKIDASR
ncbi:hypothetical protein [Pseudophaeobacter sp.]|jgi:hypothetical protein|uniref:hypothetical protein n=1 Tax=Pseudophaeobacter sp. TaxID=1971739 RepID=UPI003A969633